MTKVCRERDVDIMIKSRISSNILADRICYASVLFRSIKYVMIYPYKIQVACLDMILHYRCISRVDPICETLKLLFRGQI